MSNETYRRKFVWELHTVLNRESMIIIDGRLVQAGTQEWC